jgi:hypothetical protein
MLLHGGKQAFATKLNELFTTSSQMTGREQPDVTGLIGQYAHGNEPSHHMAYLFNHVGMPWRTQELVHQINTEFYKNTPDGLIGNEDCGQMSAWFVLSAMGFYPVTPGSGIYELGIPLFDEAKIHLENGKTFVIKAKGKTPSAKYVTATSFNNKAYTPTYIKHADLWKGGSLEFELSEKINKTRGTAVKDIPVSKIGEQSIVAVPYFVIPSNKFANEMSIGLKSFEPNTEIYYRWIQPNIRSRYVKYEKPFKITETGELQVYAQRGIIKSKEVTQPFYRIPDDKAITVTSRVHPMYTAGGPEALIDGITGTTNWKTGEWQSYFDTDFEAVIDLRVTKPVTYLGVHVLQDVSPWIMYPQEVIFYSSEDGKIFTEIKRLKNNVDQKLETVQVQQIGTELSAKARFIKVKAISGGKLPDWHESAGQPSHIFIDEIIIK